MTLGRKPGRGQTRVFLIAALMALVLLPAGSAAPDASAEPGREIVVTQQQIVPGLSFELDNNTKIPLRTYILRIDPSSPVSLDAVSPAAALGTSASTPTMINNHDGAIAGVNGDFKNFVHVGPAHPFADDGLLQQTSPNGDPAAIMGFGTAGPPVYLTTGSVQVSLHDVTRPSNWNVDRWNPGSQLTNQNQPAKGEVFGFSPWGADIADPPDNACSARLLPASGNARWADSSKSGITRSYTVDRVACQSSQMAVNGGVVLSAKETGLGADEVTALVPGDSVNLTWSVPGWQGVTDIVGGSPIIVDSGQNTVDPTCARTNYICVRNARTGVGVTSNGTVLIVVVDGKVPGSKGVGLFKFATIMRNLGAVEAINLDGDGSSQMIVNGQTVNHPGDPNRKVSSALAVLPGADPDLHIDPAT